MTRKDYQTLSDAELTELLKASDHAAYTEIYRRYAKTLYVHAYKKLQNEELAKDIIQDLFTSIWHKRDIYNIPGGNLDGYLYRAMRNRIFEFFSHEKVERKYLDSLQAFIKSNHSPTADYQIREKQLQSHIDKKIAKLTPKMKVIFELSRKEQLSYSEIAAQLNTSKNNVSKQIRNALKILKTTLNIIIFIYLLFKA
ncbi:RNA polymerase sigma factor [Mucilaginibacter paludis]|uniref:RNA polymerase, sigma-24 subunit, ECF subfamily n=1 Tax=Mucilaginibacter paludis DSM 18603 TaxID=714943 RepID=H1Y470_9SPHI|nr:RNA polymerase sigma-70 factor [Mucilaginibacter paludis]EHQ24806.1 RNA polymerase, sigma-24 subunit, ECF subfamily [Mucilaginibacter paludis DSM 18603]